MTNHNEPKLESKRKNGIQPTAKMFNISKSTVNSILVEYNKALNEVSKSSSEKASTLESLPERKRVGTTLLPKDIGAKVIQMIKSLREAGVGINYNVMIGIANGLIAANDRTMLVENGGILEITETWAQSITRRLVRRKSTTCKQPMSPGYIREIGFIFYRNIAETVAVHNIHDSLILNLEQTPLPFFLVGKRVLSLFP